MKFRNHLVCGLLTLGCFGYGKAYATLSDNMAQREIRFAQELVELNLSKYAQLVTERLAEKRPDLADYVNVIDARILIRKQQFDEAERLVAALPKGSAAAQDVQLYLANVLYYNGEVERAKGIYDAFFSQFPEAPTEASLKKQYLEAAFTQGIMARKAGDMDTAIQSLERAIAAEPEEVVARKLKAELAQTLVDNADKKSGGERDQMLIRAEELAHSLTWQQDLFFGQAVGVLAQLKLSWGVPDQAVEIIDEYMPTLRLMEESMEEQGLGLKESPVASMRYLKGKILFDQARTAFEGGDEKKGTQLIAKSAKESFNVFVKYAESPWSGRAGTLYGDANNLLKEQTGKEFKVQIDSDQMAKAAEAQLRYADEAFAAGRFEEALGLYEDLVNQFPEVPVAIKALRNLAVCYAESGNDLSTLAISSYIGERFGGQGQEAGDALLFLAKHYTDKREEDKGIQIFDLFGEHCPQHDQAPKVLYLLSEAYRNRGDEARADAYLNRIKEAYPNSPFYLSSLRKQAQKAYEQEDFQAAAAAFKTYADNAPLGLQQAEGRFLYAFSEGKNRNYGTALKAFKSLKEDMENESEGNPLYRPGDETYEELKRKISFHFAQTLAQVPKDHELAPRLFAMAENEFNAFLETYPNVEKLSPAALYGRGRVELQLGKHQQATRSFNELADRFPEDPLGKSALFSLVQAAIEADQTETAREAVQRMLQQKDSYGADEFIRVGNLMAENGFYGEAVRCLEIVQEHPDAKENASLQQRALMTLGKSYIMEGKCQEGVNTLTGLLEKYPRSGFKYEAELLLSDAYVCLEDYIQAKVVLEDAQLMARDPLIKTRVGMQFGKINELSGDLSGAMISYFNVALFSKTDQEGMAPIVEEAFIKGAKIAREQEEWETLMELARGYVEKFPDGKESKRFYRTINEMKVKLAAEA